MEEDRPKDDELSSRQRVLTALRHEEPDRVPIIFGATGETSMLLPAYEALKNHLGLEEICSTRLSSRVLQYAQIDEQVMSFFQSDARSLVGPVSDRFASVDGPGDSFTDYWGITWARSPGDLYYHIVLHPVQEARSPREIAEFPWPDPEDLLDLTGIAEKAQRLRREAQYAIIGSHGGAIGVFERAWTLRGFSQFMMDLAANKKMAHALLRRVTDMAKTTTARFLREAGPYIEMFRVSDDLGMQTGLLMSPQMFREMIKPYLAEYYSLIHSLTDARLLLHTCGSVYRLIEDLIEIGVDVINPVQVSAVDMDALRLKQEFGDRLCFLGGIDTQHVLPCGTAEDVRREVHRRIHELAPGGGYLLAAVHAIQPDVPPENVCAMFEAALTYGRYRKA